MVDDVALGGMEIGKTIDRTAMSLVPSTVKKTIGLLGGFPRLRQNWPLGGKDALADVLALSS
ncbi:MAG TPA: hypothetical protein EYO90_11240 [Candidatus Latescibacteria bacterium]|nr:hypothetical protein [Candidatus Latescibacterota bacterium]